MDKAKITMIWRLVNQLNVSDEESANNKAEALKLLEDED